MKSPPSRNHFKKSVAHTPQSLRALVGLAWAQLRNKNPIDALETFKKICEKDQKLVSELRKAYKYLDTQNSPETKKYSDEIQRCVR